VVHSVFRLEPDKRRHECRRGRLRARATLKLEPVSLVGHELKQIGVWVADINARRSFSAATLAGDGAFNASAVPSRTKHRSPHGGFAAGARSVNDSRCQVAGR
jgi:hypothetical protein